MSDRDVPRLPLEPLLSLRDAAVVLGVAEATLRDWRVDRKGPPAVKFGRLVRYRPSDLDEWISNQLEVVNDHDLGRS